MFGKIPFDVKQHKLDESVHLGEIKLHKLEFQQRWGSGNRAEMADLQKKVTTPRKSCRR